MSGARRHASEAAGGREAGPVADGRAGADAADGGGDAADGGTDGRARPAWEGPAGPDGGGEGHVLVLPSGLAEALARQGEAAYPAEACGVLLGRVDQAAGERAVTDLEPAANRWEGRDDRYLIDPETLRRLLEAEERGGPRVLGFYHSHPDAPPRPSATDRELAWPWYHYLIVPVEDGRANPARAWEVDGGDGPFVERTVRIAEDPVPDANEPAGGV